MSAVKRTPVPVQIAAAVVGNALEWYDFIVFGFLTVIISRLFFPAESQYASLLLTTATFGVGFFMRPVGGFLLGVYADRKGRKPALLLIIILMTIAIALIGFAPTYASIGVGAPMIIVLARLLQGFATGGEFGSATTFLVECAPPHRRGFYGSWQYVGQGLALLLGALFGAMVTRGLTAEAIDNWGWRVPFLFGLILGPVGYFIRRHLDESPAFIEAQEETHRSDTAFGGYLKPGAVSVGLISSATISFYVILVYMPTFARTQLHLSLDDAFLAQSISLACMVLVIPFSGALSDRIGRRPIILCALLLYLAVTYPLFHWLYESPSFARLAVTQISLCSILGVFFGPLSTAVAEQFPVRARSTSLGITSNIAVMVFGGFAQLFVTWLIQVTGSPIAPSFYVIFGASVGVIASLFLMDTVRDVRPSNAVLLASQ